MPDSERSQHLKNHIVEAIQKAGGCIPFSTYMEHALYTPNLGYYMANNPIFGETTGDFITAPELSPLFGQTLAQACHKIIKEMPHAVILELGAGTGKLAVDLIKTLQTLGTPPESYWIIDPSPTLRERQRETLNRMLPECSQPNSRTSIQWLETYPTKPFCGIVIANEVLDAMPAQRFQITPEHCFETFVTYQQNTFQEIHQLTDDPDIHTLAEWIRKTSPTLENEPYQSERLPQLKSFFNHLFAALTQGAIFLIDYGFPQHEFYHPDRHMGTLMCHYQQRSHTNPYEFIGLQDITTHVDFTDVAEKATQAGFELAGYTQQAAFLMNAGLLSLIPPTPDLTTTKAINLLTSPSEMGELFKVMALTKKLDIDYFPGFEHFDKRHTL